MSTTRVAALTTFVLLVASCGARTSTATPTTVAPTTVNSTATAGPGSDPRNAQQLAADQALAAKAVLQLSDLPAGWQGKPHHEQVDGHDTGKLLSDCMHLSLAFFAKKSPAKAYSQDFTSPDKSEVFNNVDIEASVQRVQEELTFLKRADLPGCFAKAMSALLDYSVAHPSSGSPPPKGVTFGNPTVGQVSFPQIGDATIVYRVTVPVSASGIVIDVYLDLILVAKGRAGFIVTATGIASPLPTQTEQKLAQTVADRLP